MTSPMSPTRSGLVARSEVAVIAAWIGWSDWGEATRQSPWNELIDLLSNQTFRQASICPFACSPQKTLPSFFSPSFLPQTGNILGKLRIRWHLSKLHVSFFCHVWRGSFFPSPPPFPSQKETTRPSRGPSRQVLMVKASWATSGPGLSSALLGLLWRTSPSFPWSRHLPLKRFPWRSCSALLARIVDDLNVHQLFRARQALRLWACGQRRLHKLGFGRQLHKNFLGRPIGGSLGGRQWTLPWFWGRRWLGRCTWQSCRRLWRGRGSWWRGFKPSRWQRCRCLWLGRQPPLSESQQILQLTLQLPRVVDRNYGLGWHTGDNWKFQGVPTCTLSQNATWKNQVVSWVHVYSRGS